MTEDQARKDVETYSSLVAMAKRELDTAMASLAEYSRKLADAASYLSN